MKFFVGREGWTVYHSDARLWPWFAMLRRQSGRAPAGGLNAWQWMPDVFRLTKLEINGITAELRPTGRTWYWTRRLTRVLVAIDAAIGADLRSVVSDFSLPVFLGTLGALIPAPRADTPPDADHLTIAAGNGPLGLVLRT